jgi:hypothetical protein
MTNSRSIASAYVAALIVAGCASSGSSTASADRIVPPQMTSRAQLSEMRFPASAATGTTIYIDVDVVIDSTGVPDMTSFRANGQAAADNRSALYEWIQSSVFRPAHTTNGHPVSAVFHTQIQVRGVRG